MISKEEYLKALDKSCQHWLEVANDPLNTNTNAEDCQLCVLTRFLNVTGFVNCLNPNRCSRCPVYWVTGQTNCHGSPYTEFFSKRRHIKKTLRKELGRNPTFAELKTLRFIAIDEYKFLNKEVRQAIEDHFKEPTYHVGQHFKHKLFGSIFVLSLSMPFMSDYDYLYLSLTNIKSGEPFCGRMVRVKDDYVTQEIFNAVASNDADDFEPVEIEIKVKDKK